MATNDTPAVPRSQPDQVFFLSEINGARVMLRGKKIGTLSDLVIMETGKIPEVRQIVVTRPFGKPALLIPWEKVSSMEDREIHVEIGEMKDFEGEPAENAVLLRDHILDKKVLDMEDREVEMVYDIKMVLKNQRLYATDVDTSRYGLLRRIGLAGLANFIYSLAEKIKDQTISWTYIQPLPTQISSFRGDVKLNILRERLEGLHPVDLADILEDLDPDQRRMIFDGLSHEQASDTLEEIEPMVQRELISTLAKDKVVQLIDLMTPGQAADLLSVLPSPESTGIIGSLKAENAKKVRAILEKQEEKVINYTTAKFLKFPPDMTVEQAQNEYDRAAKGKDVIMYLYVVDSVDRLLGVIDIKELLLAPDQAPLKDVMVDTVIGLKPDSTLKEASALFARYDFRAIPVLDDQDTIFGVVPYRDVMNLTHHFLE
jgi:CBS domain-containing protein/sporulation protein YlmC with PRC-barrel domain